MAFTTLFRVALYKKSVKDTVFKKLLSNYYKEKKKMQLIRLREKAGRKREVLLASLLLP